jgi:hypothetical protein
VTRVISVPKGARFARASGDTDEAEQLVEAVADTMERRGH